VKRLARHARWAIVALCCALLLPAAARASGSEPRVVLVVPPAPDELLSEAFNRLRAELALQGFETRTIELGPDNDTPDKLSELAQRTGAFAGISLVQRVGTPTAEVCIADRVTGKTTLRTLALDKRRDAPSVLAVRTTDLLRASLRELDTGRPPPDVIGADRKPPAPVIERFASPPVKRFRLDARVALLGFDEKIGPGFGPGLALSYRVSPRFSVSVLLIGPAVGASFDSSLGSATVRQELALARVGYAVLHSERFELRPALCAGVYHLDANGVVGPPLQPLSNRVTSFAAGLGVEAEIRLSGALVAGAELSALALGPRPGIAVSNERYLFVQPYLSASAGIGVEF